MNTQLVKNKMQELGIKQEYLADKLKIAQATLNLKLNNQRKTSIEEMFQIQELLKIKDDELKKFFV